MSSTTLDTVTETDLQLTTFYLGEMLLGMPIGLVQEINRNLEITEIPHAPAHVRGVINLRGEVATVIDLRAVLGLPPSDVTEHSRNLIIRTAGEPIGIYVDRIADIIRVASEQIDPTPANLSGAESRYFSGVLRGDREILMILNVDEVLGHE